MTRYLVSVQAKGSNHLVNTDARGRAMLCRDWRARAGYWERYDINVFYRNTTSASAATTPLPFARTNSGLTSISAMRS